MTTLTPTSDTADFMRAVLAALEEDQEAWVLSLMHAIMEGEHFEAFLLLADVAQVLPAGFLADRVQLHKDGSASIKISVVAEYEDEKVDRLVPAGRIPWTTCVGEQWAAEPLINCYGEHLLVIFDETGELFDNYYAGDGWDGDDETLIAIMAGVDWSKIKPSVDSTLPF